MEAFGDAASDRKSIALKVHPTTAGPGVPKKCAAAPIPAIRPSFPPDADGDRVDFFGV